MKAIVVEKYGAVPESARLHAVPASPPGEGEVLVEVRAAAVNFADILSIEGRYQARVPTPFIPGREAAGIVVDVGPSVKSVKRGDRVLAYVEAGAYAETMTAAEHECHRLPDGLAFTAAVSLGLNYQTALIALTRRAGLQPGESVLVTGASGGVGLASIQVARALGARVFALVSRPEKQAIVKDAGADVVITGVDDDPKEQIRQSVYAVNQGRGVDVVLDCLGGDVFDGCLRALEWQGRVVVIGFVAGRIPSVATNYLLVKNIAVVGMYWDSYRAHMPETVGRVQQEIFDLWSAGVLRPPEAQCFPLAKFAEAAAIFAQRRAQGRLILEPHGASQT
jgi:NADPH2:quinone reductase